VLDPEADCTAAALQGPLDRAQQVFTSVSLKLIRENKYNPICKNWGFTIYALKGSRIGSYRIRVNISPNVVEKNVKLLFQKADFTYTMTVKHQESSRLQIPERLVGDIFQLEVTMMT